MATRVASGARQPVTVGFGGAGFGFGGDGFGRGFGGEGLGGDGLGGDADLVTTFVAIERTVGAFFADAVA